MDFFVTDYRIPHSPDQECAVLEDSIMQKGRPVTAGSKILSDFISPIDATVVKKLEAAGIAILGKTTMDEFGATGLFIGSNAKTDRLERGIGAENPKNRDIEPNNGSKEPKIGAIEQQLGTPCAATLNGAILAVAEGAATFALCNDYTGMTACLAARQGLICIRPTYGTVSRFGLIPAVPSMDQIGVVCKTIDDGSNALSVIAGYDNNDGAMFNTPGENSDMQIRLSPGTEQTKKLRIGVPVNVTGKSEDMAAIKDFAKDFNIVQFELKHFEVYAQIMQILCCAELANCISRYDGIKFGYRAEGYSDLRELYTMTRTQAFGPDAKLAALVGAAVLSQDNYLLYYDKAMRIRRLIKESLDFSEYDMIILPAGSANESGIETGNSAEKSGDQLNKHSPLALNALPRLCGLPAVTFAHNGGAITLTANQKSENILFTALKAEKTL